MMISPQAVEDACPARAEVARGRHPPRARDPAAVGRRDHRDDQGERAEPDRVRRLEPHDSRVILDPAGRREPARPGRHALQAARHLAAPARSGRVRLRGRGDPRRRAVPPPARPGSRRDAARAPGGRPRRTTATTPASSTRTRIRCSRRRSRSSSRLRPPPFPCSSARRSRSATPAPAGCIDMLERRGTHSGYEGSKAPAGARGRSGSRTVRNRVPLG